MEVKKVVVDTDILIGHVLESTAGASTLRSLMQSYFCYTTVFNAIEAFSLCQSDGERRVVEQSMHAMKILGLNAKSGKSVGAMFSRHGRTRDLHLLAAGVCIESRLPYVSMRTKAFRGVKGLALIHPKELVGGDRGKR